MPQPDKPWRSPDKLRSLYVEQEMTVKEVADELGCADVTVRRWLKRTGVGTRSAYDASNMRHDQPYRDRAWLLERYEVQELSTEDIADECGCSKETIRRWLENHDIHIRSKSEAAKIRAERHPHTIPDGDHLADYNWWDILTEEEQEEARQRLSENRQGEDNPMWNVTGEDHPQYNPDRESVDFYSRTKWKKTRERVYERDDHECQDCGDAEFELHAHHQTPVSEGGAPFDMGNITTLCARCHDDRHPNVDILSAVQAQK